MKKYELMYRTITESRERRKIANTSTNELIHKIKLALLGNDESIIDEYDISIEFYDYGSIDLNTALSLIYDDVIIKRSSLFDYIKNTYDTVNITFKSDKIKDSADQYVNVDISYDIYILKDKPNENIKKKFLFDIYVSLLNNKALMFISIKE